MLRYGCADQGLYSPGLSPHLAGRNFASVTAGVTSVYDLDGHPYFSLFRLAVDKVGEHFEALLQLDIRHDVGERFAKPRRLVLIGGGEGIDRGAPAAFYPLHLRRHATGAQRARIVA